MSVGKFEDKNWDYLSFNTSAYKLAFQNCPGKRANVGMSHHLCNVVINVVMFGMPASLGTYWSTCSQGLMLYC